MKYKEKFGTVAKNLTDNDGNIIYPVKTLVAKGRCKNGENKGRFQSKFWKISKNFETRNNIWNLTKGVWFFEEQNVPVVRGNTHRSSKIGQNVQNRAERVNVMKDVLEKFTCVGGQFGKIITAMIPGWTIFHLTNGSMKDSALPTIRLYFSKECRNKCAIQCKKL